MSEGIPYEFLIFITDRANMNPGMKRNLLRMKQNETKSQHVCGDVGGFQE